MKITNMPLNSLDEYYSMKFSQSVYNLKRYMSRLSKKNDLNFDELYDYEILQLLTLRYFITSASFENEYDEFSFSGIVNRYVVLYKLELNRVNHSSAQYKEFNKIYTKLKTNLSKYDKVLNSTKANEYGFTDKNRIFGYINNFVAHKNYPRLELWTKTQEVFIEKEVVDTLSLLIIQIDELLSCIGEKHIHIVFKSSNC